MIRQSERERERQCERGFLPHISNSYFSGRERERERERERDRSRKVEGREERKVVCQ